MSTSLISSEKYTKEQLKAIEDCVITAYNAGVPQDQLEQFLGRGYVPLPWQMKFHALARSADKDDGPVKIGAGGARGPGKSHAVLAQSALDDCQRVPGLKGLFLRQTGKAAQESFEDLIGKVLRGKIRYKYNPSRSTLKFPNGSKILLGGFETEKDVDKYIGIEYDFIDIEELNQLTEEKTNKLEGSLRTSKPNWRPRMYVSFNPGGIGHQFVKKTFVDPFTFKEEKRTRFVPSTYKQNPYLNKEYIVYLENLGGALGKAWREGNFDSFEGQYFSEWNKDKHVVPPFQIPISWHKYRAYDHGRTKPACCKWYAVDQDGRVWVYRELYIQGKNADEIAKEISRLSEGESYRYSVADPSIFAKMGFVDQYGGETIAETMARNGAMFIPASNRRVDGWNLMHQYLGYTETEPPKMLYFSTCYNSIRTIPSLIHDDLRPEDLDSDGEDHAADTDRYFLTSLHEQSSPRPMSDVEKKLRDMQEKSSVGPSSLNEFYLGEKK